MGADLAIPFKGKDGGYRAVEEIAVMADNQDGAVIIGNHLLQQIQRFHIQIIGRLVQHQEIMRLGKQFRQQQAVLFAARQGGHLLCHLVIVKQKVAQIGGHMFGDAGHLDHVGAAICQDCPGG